MNGLLCCVVQLLCCVYNENWICKGTMTDTRVTSIIIVYRQRIYKPYVPSTTYVWATPGANGAPNKLFIAFLFSDDVVGVQLFKDVGLIPNSMACCKCGPQLSWCVNSSVKVVYWWRYLRLISASACRASTSVSHGTRFQQNNLIFIEVLLTTYDIFRRDPPNTIQQEHLFCSATISEWAKLCREVMLDYVPGSSQKIFSPKKTVEIDDSKFRRRKYTK